MIEPLKVRTRLSEDHGFMLWVRQNPLDDRWDVMQRLDDMGPWELLDHSFVTEEAARAYVEGWLDGYDQGSGP